MNKIVFHLEKMNGGEAFVLLPFFIRKEVYFMKHFVDIAVLREKDEDLGNGLIKRGNAYEFREGDLISITEKVDGSNASICLEDNIIKAFSRRELLSYENTLEGFFCYVQKLNKDILFNIPSEKQYVVFGEWLRRNKIKYLSENMYKWYVYSIFDKATNCWLTPEKVKEYCARTGLIYVNELYYGHFISWEHCRSFCNSPKYGDKQEGVVIRNIDALSRNIQLQAKGAVEGLHFGPHILKIVNDDFKESMKARVREVDLEKEAERARALELMQSIVTKNRVTKMLFKLRDENIIPDELTPEHMSVIAKNLPKRIFEDCLKEEPEIVEACAAHAGKMCSSITMKIVRDMVC